MLFDHFQLLNTGKDSKTLTFSYKTSRGTRSDCPSLAKNYLSTATKFTTAGALLLYVA
jgi:hypothetical protein